MRHRARRPVAIEDLQPEALRREVLLHACERRRRRTRQQAARSLISVDAGADEIVFAEIAHVDDQPVDDRGGIHEA